MSGVWSRISLCTCLCMGGPPNPDSLCPEPMLPTSSLNPRSLCLSTHSCVRMPSSARDSEHAAVTSRPGKAQDSGPAWCIFLFLLASTLWTPGPHPPLYYCPHYQVHATPPPGGNMSFRKGDPVEVSALTAIRGLQEMPGGPVKGSQSLPDSRDACPHPCP